MKRYRTLGILLLSAVFLSFTQKTVLFGVKWPYLGHLAWVVLVPIFMLIPHLTRRDSFYCGFWFGIYYYSLCLYWVAIALLRYGEVSALGSALGLGALVGFLSIFHGILFGGLHFFSKHLRSYYPLAAAAWWVLLDYVKNYIPLGGFPWASLGYSQSAFLTLLQLVDLTGIYGITFLLVFTNAVVAQLLSNFRHRNQGNEYSLGHNYRQLVILVTLIACVLFYGNFRLKNIRLQEAALEKTRVALVQGNIPQEEKWIQDKTAEIIQRHVSLTKQVGKRGVDLVVWPEASYPAIMPWDVKMGNYLKDFSSPILMGVVTFDGDVDQWMKEGYPEDPSRFRLYNSGVIVEKGGRIGPMYHKNHLVPMGEYVPFQKYLPFLHQIVASMNSFTPGPELKPLRLRREGRPDLLLGVNICYEDLFPQFARTLTRENSDLLINLTNDGWYDFSSAVYQHFDFSRYRVIENRISLVRSTNTGVSGVLSPSGEIILELTPFAETTGFVDVPIGDIWSFYTEYGDVFAWACLASVVLLGLKAVMPKKEIS